MDVSAIIARLKDLKEVVVEVLLVMPYASPKITIQMVAIALRLISNTGALKTLLNPCQYLRKVSKIMFKIWVKIRIIVIVIGLVLKLPRLGQAELGEK